MNVQYRCPACEGSLTTKAGVVLVGEHQDRRTLFIFDPKPGSYSLEVADQLPVEPGTTWEFFCPLCRENLTSPVKHRLIRLELIEPNGKARIDRHRKGL